VEGIGGAGSHDAGEAKLDVGADEGGAAAGGGGQESRRPHGGMAKLGVGPMRARQLRERQPATRGQQQEEVEEVRGGATTRRRGRAQCGAGEGAEGGRRSGRTVAGRKQEIAIGRIRFGKKKANKGQGVGPIHVVVDLLSLAVRVPHDGFGCPCPHDGPHPTATH
jgi:hypothetical protein